MDHLLPFKPCTDTFEPLVFVRHQRMLRAILLHSQAWFALVDLARLTGIPFTERSTFKLDPDQHRSAWLLTHGEWQKCLMISESGVFALLVHHYVPENRALRRWLAQSVLPQIDQSRDSGSGDPAQFDIRWQGNRLGTLHWRGELWVNLRDLPELVQVQQVKAHLSIWGRLIRSFWGRSQTNVELDEDGYHK